jgi:hypothetical protein
MDSFERTTMALSFPNKSRAFDATRRAVRFWGHDSAMEVAFFVTEDALRRVQPHMRLDEAGLLRAFDSNRADLRDGSQGLCARPQRLIRSGELRLLGRADGDTCIPYAERGQAMRFYIFKSETRKDLRAFAGDLAGSRLPQNHGPWTATGAIGPDSAPPYNFSRDAIEEAIDAEGFQLWRLSKKTEAPV